MKLFAVTASAIILAGPLAAFSHRTDTALLGSWSCRIEAGAVSADYVIEYASLGRTNVQGVMTMEDGGSSIAMSIRYVGRWAMNGDRLTETVTSGEVEAVEIDGETMPPTFLPQQITDTMFSATAEYIVAEVSEEGLVLRDPSVGDVTCRRL